MYKTLIIIVAVLIGVFLLYRFLNPYLIRTNNIFFVSGSPGTGKDVLSHKYALKRYKAGMRKWKRDRLANKITNLFKKKKDKEPFTQDKPIFYSSIPVLVKLGRKKKEVSKELTLDMLMLRKKLPNYSVVYISDLNRFINQWTYKNINVQENIAEFISEFRQYTKGGYFIANAQNSSQVAKEIRNTFGKTRNNLSFKKFLMFFKIEGRTITLSDEVSNVEQGDADNKANITNVYGFINPFISRYDTYAYYGRVHDMEVEHSKEYEYSNTNKFLELPSNKIEPNTINEIGTYTNTFKLNKRAIIKYLIGSVITSLVISLISQTIGLYTLTALLTTIVLLFIDARS